ncbi:MAG: class I SAM-dependent methyltransferase [Marinifilaceae bacterium]
MTLSEKLFGKNREEIPYWAFRLMSFALNTVDILTNYSSRNFKRLGIQKGQTVVDYGCGPARYIRNISVAVGEEGKLYATDIHPLAIKKANEKIRKFDLQNVEAIITKAYNCPVQNHTADIILALDMFHMVRDSKSLLREFHRIAKPQGMVIIEDGHQPRKETNAKIMESGYFTITSENKHHVKCKPIHNQ